MQAGPGTRRECFVVSRLRPDRAIQTKKFWKLNEGLLSKAQKRKAMAGGGDS